ncbi:hypothetical protein Hamer_G019603 [Homarus americanus]|uniref:Uncharacterized protein n=1 Tax=Homarus americanus TaxID=6706 RepID=A0A8J5MZL8_HOMAM|nr:hypothetical protein Hamer_G019603 [Homarus americanus]
MAVNPHQLRPQQFSDRGLALDTFPSIPDNIRNGRANSDNCKSPRGSRSLSESGRFQSHYNVCTSFQVSQGELIELGPALWDVGPTLLNNSMEPSQDKEGLSTVNIIPTGNDLWRP